MIRLRTRLLIGAALVVIAALWLSACNLPWGPSGPTIIVTNTNTATNGQQPSPGPSAAPSPGAPGTACRLAPMPDCGGPEGPAGVYGCCQRADQGRFAAQVDQAIAALQVEQPGLFNGNRVLNGDAYVAGVAKILERSGLCAQQGGPSDEVAVKADNGSSEQYDILLASGSIRTQGIVASCRPARF